MKREAKAKMRVAKAAFSAPAAVAPASPSSSSPPDPVSSTDDAPPAVAQPLPPASPAAAPPSLTPEQRELLSRLLFAQQQYEAPSSDALSKLTVLPPPSLLPLSKSHPLCQAFTGTGGGMNEPFQHLAELTILSVQLIVEFTKSLPGFLTLDSEDQLTLLKVHPSGFSSDIRILTPKTVLS